MGRTKEVESRAQEEPRKEKIKKALLAVLPDKEVRDVLREEVILGVEMAALFISVFLYAVSIACMHEEHRDSALLLVFKLQPKIEQVVNYIQEVSQGQISEEAVFLMLAAVCLSASYIFFDRINSTFDYEGW